MAQIDSYIKRVRMGCNLSFLDDIFELYDVDVVKIADFGLVKVPDSNLTSLKSELKGSLNDPDLINVGFSNYQMCQQYYLSAMMEQ